MSKKLIDNKTKAKLVEVGEVILYWIGGIILISVASTILYYLVVLVLLFVT
ncbi:hypothetical protein [Winogradskyella psychrotolerans]|uniref:hypothetical protein n=1 Tax=Winogradskyella psychrotolerans TaxID=1344585 RepID=UPI001C068E45|nr:hypothetical protein [Winogradskyella psychrotolerans]MBU2928542.1 hypothetical protein [Winogradskyella psychrotolerans]